MKTRITLMVALILCTVIHSKAQSRINKTTDEVRIEIEAINSKIEQLYQTENVQLLVNLYAEQLTFFPEYKPAVFDSKKLKSFYTDWFKTVQTKSYKKKIYKVEVLSNYILEMGNFNSAYITATNSPLYYNGKYMILWKRDKKGNLRIVSEAFGSDKYIEPENVPYSAVQVQENNLEAKDDISKELMAEIEEFNAEVIKAVMDGNGEARAKGFTKDGIYMPHFDLILDGMDAIRPYMLKTYTPGSLIKVKHTYNRIYDLGEYVFVNGHFKGSWGDTTNGGKLEGNMSNLMKRNENGMWLMHRQIGNNDRK
jgi:ketosteroid isomerase-like protein